MQSSKITAAISTYNREKYLPKVLDSLVKQTLSSDLFEIIIVDNNSPGNTKEIAEEFIAKNTHLNCRYVLETSQGLSYGRNRGIAESVAPLITFIDDDAYLQRNYLEVLVRAFEENEEVCAIGGKILLDYEELVPNWENKYLNSLLGFYCPSEQRFKYNDKDYPRGSNMTFRVAVFSQIGNFNVSLGRKGASLAGGEEKDIFNRIYKTSAMVIYLPEAVVYHYVPLERTQSGFIKKQGVGTGSSEAVRVLTEGKLSWLKRFLAEFVKWMGSIGLFFIYLIKFKPAKGIMIIRFRWWVTSGFLFGKKVG